MDEHPKQLKQKDKKSRQQPSAKLRGNPRDTPTIRLSKTLSYVLRHGAEKEGIRMRPDGFVLVNDLVGKLPCLPSTIPSVVIVLLHTTVCPPEVQGTRP